jgi:phenylalanyl-tRNA synthetase beta subunit
MVSKELAESSGYDLTEHVKLQNPLTEDRVYLRRSLLPSLQEFVLAHPLEKQLTVYELAHVYQPAADHQEPVGQQLQLAIVSNEDIRTVKTVLESLAQELFQQPFSYVEEPAQPPYVQQAAIISQQQRLGRVVIFPNTSIGVEIDMVQLAALSKTHPEYRPVQRTSIIKEDLTFALANKTAVGTLLRRLSELSPLIKTAAVHSLYQQNLTLRFWYQHATENCTAEMVAPVRAQIVEVAKKEFSAELVGTLINSG